MPRFVPLKGGKMTEENKIKNSKGEECIVDESVRMFRIVKKIPDVGFNKIKATKPALLPKKIPIDSNPLIPFQKKHKPRPPIGSNQ